MGRQIKNNKIQNSSFIFLEGLKSCGRLSHKSTNKKKSGLIAKPTFRSRYAHKPFGSAPVPTPSI